MDIRDKIDFVRMLGDFDPAAIPNAAIADAITHTEMLHVILVVKILKGEFNSALNLSEEFQKNMDALVASYYKAEKTNG